MSNIENGGTAFPHDEIIIGSRGIPAETGMTLRDYFAAKAMQGILACESDTGIPAYDIAEFAYAQADAMLKVRKYENL